MDILLRLRLLLWLLVLSLWGVMVYQFLEDEGADLPRMRWIAKPLTRFIETPAEPPPRRPSGMIFPPKPAEEPEPARPLGPPLAAAPAAAPSLELPRPATRQEPFAVTAPSLRRSPIARPTAPPTRPLPPIEETPEAPPIPEPPDTPAPPGFRKSRTAHFVVYAERREAGEEFLQRLENLHANLMLDLAAFSPWARDQRVNIYLFRTQESYRQITGRPAWSGGASSVRRRKIYLYESEEMVGILAHELCHIYFDSFFRSGEGNPLWLSEGMATLVQTERGLSAPNWLSENLRALRRGGGYTIDDLVKVESTADASDEQVRLWYSQSYSVVRFLIRSQYRSSFYQFCRHLREGAPMADALYRSYGMPFNRLKALEYAWRYDLQSRR